MFMGYTTKDWIISICGLLLMFLLFAVIHMLAVDHQRISVHGENGDEMRPLHDAVLERDFDKVEELISLGADVNAKNERWGMTPMHYAATWSIIELLLAEGADINAAIKVLRSKKITMGPKTREVEAYFKDHIVKTNSLMVNSGSSANLLIFQCLISFENSSNLSAPTNEKLELDAVGENVLFSVRPE